VSTRKLSTLLLATAATLGIGMGSTFAQGSPSADGYVYPNFWGQVYSQPTPKGQTVAQSHTNHSNGTWLFPPDPNGGGGG
jgi:hypothetical protein